MDTLLLGGQIYTMDVQQPKVEAMLIRDDRIVFTGTNHQADDFINRADRIVDLGGAAVLPGLIDAHTHFTDYSLQSVRIHLRDLTRFPDVITRIHEFVAKTPPGEWILGGRWDKNIWVDQTIPHRKYLDAISTIHPIALSAKDGHSMWVNSKVLEMIGYSKADPPHLQIERDPETDELTGVLYEEAGWKIYDFVPEPNQQQRHEAVLNGIRTAHRLGLCSVHCCETPSTFHHYQELVTNHGPKIRFYHMIPHTFLNEAITLGLQTGFGNEWLRIGAIKIFSDGALGSRTAYLLEPYENSAQSGIAIHSPEELCDLIRRANRAGLATAIHAIGDRANRLILDTYEKVRSELNDIDRRNRIEHAQMLHPDDQPRLAKLNVIASMQPIHLAADVNITDKHTGVRGQEAYVFRNLLNFDTDLAFGSDAPIETIDPFQGIYAAVERKYQNNPENESWFPDQKLTVHEAVYGYTMGAAYAAGEENLKGSLTPGKLADCIVLDRNIFEVPSAEILKIKVDLMFLGGDVVYGTN